MTYATEAQRSGREPVTIVEIDLDYCANTYGSAPCTASVGTTGERKCFNTRVTCQDKANYDRTTKTYRFCTSNEGIPPTAQAIPCLVSADITPAKITPGEGLGQRASVTLTFRDFPHHDRGIDPYVSERDYNPEDRGTFWAKLLRRNRYTEGRTLRLKTGYLGESFSLDNFQTRTYLIDRIEGPDSKGRVRVIAKDPLRMLDSDKAIVPQVSSAGLGAGITSSYTGFIALDALVDWAAPGYARIDDEIIYYSSIGTTGSVTSISGITRARYGSTAAAHDAGATVQPCFAFNERRVDLVIQDLLEEAGIPSAYIPTSEWDEEGDVWLETTKVHGVVSEPTPARDTLKDLLEQTGVYLWWDEVAATIKLLPLRPPTAAVKELDEDEHIVADTLKLKEDPRKRASQIWFRYAPDNQIDRTLQSLYVLADVAAGSDDEYGSDKIKQIDAHFVSGNTTGTALTVAGRTLGRLRDTPRVYSFALDAKDHDLRIGDPIDVQARTLIDDTGAPETRRLQIVSIRESEAGHRVEVEAVDYQFKGRYAFIGPNTLPDYGSATEAQKRDYAYIAPNSGTFDDGEEAYKII